MERCAVCRRARVANVVVVDGIVTNYSTMTMPGIGDNFLRTSSLSDILSQKKILHLRICIESRICAVFARSCCCSSSSSHLCTVHGCQYLLCIFCLDFPPGTRPLWIYDGGGAGPHVL